MGKACTFIGDNYIPEYVSFECPLYETIFDLIENRGVDTFYFSQNNKYQKICHKLVLLAKKDYPNIKTFFATIRLSFMKELKKFDTYDDVVFTNRNIHSPHFKDPEYNHKWAIDNSDIVVVYALRDTYKLKSYIEKSSKEVIKMRKCYSSGKSIFDFINVD